MQSCSTSTRKPVEELVAFLSNHEQEAVERTGKRKTNGPDMTIPRCTQQSFLIVLESLTSLTNTLTEVGHSHLLDRICFESMTTLVVECFSKECKQTTTCLQWLTTLTEEHAASKAMRVYQVDFSYFTGPNSFFPEKIIKGEPPKHQDATKEEGSNNRRNRFQRRRHKTRSCNARVCWRVWRRPETGKCPLKIERANWHPALCP